MDISENMFCVTGCSDYSIQKSENVFKFEIKNLQKEAVISWEIPFVDMLYAWHPTCETKRLSVPGCTESMFSISAPMFCIYNGRKENKYTVALSETREYIKLNGTIVEENGCIKTEIIIPVFECDISFSVLIDTECKSFEKAIDDVRLWWENKCGLKPMAATEKARLPMYSTWYSFHQNISAKALEEEAERAKAVGFSTIIVDDGWQCDDNNRGYAYCGDWEPSESKFPDMRTHVENVHKIGLSYMLWFSVPFVGKNSKKYKEFKNMQLYYMEDMDAAVLDPRYKAVREYLVSTYKNALVNWNLDGFKLYFIDCFINRDNVPFNTKMDCGSVQKAVDMFLFEIKQTLTAIKPDIMIEFRQRYIGPCVRKYGNILRVVDCPNTYVSNRIGTIDLRLMSGETAVHSDMLMWHKDESAENAALQIINIIFSTMQFSVKLDTMSDEHKKMLAFWIEFMSKNKKLLLETPLSAADPQSLYTAASVHDDEQSITAVYNADKCVSVKGDTVIINGTQESCVIAETDKDYCVEVKNCMGETQYRKNICCGISRIPVPIGGLAEFYAIEL